METAALADLMQERFPREQLQTRRHAGMRYRGQSYEVSVPVPRLREPGDVADLVRRFHDAHQRRYGHMAEAETVEIVNFQVTAIGLIPKPVMKTFNKTDTPAAPPTPCTRASSVYIYFKFNNLRKILRASRPWHERC